MKILRCYPNWYHNSILLDKCKYLSKALYGNSHTERQKGSQAPNSPEQIYFMCCLDLLFLWVVGSLQKNKKLMINMTGLTSDCVRITCKSWDILMQVQVMHTGNYFSGLWVFQTESTPHLSDPFPFTARIAPLSL